MLKKKIAVLRRYLLTCTYVFIFISFVFKMLKINIYRKVSRRR